MPTQRADELKSQPIRWSWRRRIPRGKLTTLSGDPGVGKTTVVIDVAARRTAGATMPFSKLRCQPESVLYISAEDDPADTLKPRFEAAGAQLDLVHILGPEHVLVLPDEFAAIDKTIERHNIGFVVIDPITAMLSEGVNPHQDASVRRVLSNFASIAMKHHCAVVIIRHLNKSRNGTAMQRGSGSIAFTAAARVELLVGRSPVDEDELVLATVKNNLSPHASSLRFEITSSAPGVSGVDWLGTCGYSADEIVSAHGGRVRKVDRAEQLLLEQLRGGRRKLKRDLLDAAKNNGISERTLETAKANLGVKDTQISEPGCKGPGRSWWWL